MLGFQQAHGDGPIRAVQSRLQAFDEGNAPAHIVLPRHRLLSLFLQLVCGIVAYGLKQSIAVRRLWRILDLNQ